ncbi:MAG: acyltransferase [Acidimicrobiia bacterium]|nr:acyltransferase [Acidimicrobiia bacterium]
MAAVETKPVHVDTPLYEGRGEDRLITVFRGVSMILVVGVHIGMTEVSAAGTGLAAAFAGWYVDLFTWLIAWVSLFFLVSGALMRNADKIPYWAYVRQRLLRLLMPYYVYVAIMLPIEILLWKVFPQSVCGDFSMPKVLTWALPLHEDCLGLNQGPLWFIQVFLVFAVLAPFIVRLYDSRLRHWVVPATLVALGVFDYLWISGSWGRPMTIGAATADDADLLIFFVLHVHLFWFVVFYLGLYYADGYTKRLEGKYLQIGVAFTVLTFFLVAGIPGVVDALYPPRVFGYLWAERGGGNQFPPTLAWLTATLAAAFVALWARKAIVTWSWRPRVSPTIEWLFRNSLTLLIWHLVAYEIVYWSVRLLGGLPFFEDTLRGINPVLERIAWLALTAPLIYLLVTVFAPLERLDWGKYLVWPSAWRRKDAAVEGQSESTPAAETTRP